MAESFQQLEKRANRLACENMALKETLKLGLEIHDEYLSQIGKCVSQDYGRLNEFPVRCREHGLEVAHDGTAREIA